MNDDSPNAENVSADGKSFGDDVYEFSNGTCRCFLLRSNIIFERKTYFVDLDEADLRAVVDWYRKGTPKSVEQHLARCINRFHKDIALTPEEADAVDVRVGEKKFCAKRKLLEQLPGLRVMLQNNSNNKLLLYRDEKMFEQVLSWLRHPEAFERRSDAAFDDELRFFGVDLKDREETALEILASEPLHSALETTKEKMTQLADVAISGGPELDFFAFKNPTTTMFVQRYLRYSAFCANTMQMHPLESAAGVWTTCSSKHTEASYTIYLCFKRQMMPVSLTELFDSVSVSYYHPEQEFDSKKSINFQYSARTMEIIAKMFDQQPFTAQSFYNDGVSITVPVPIPGMFRPSNAVHLHLGAVCKVQLHRGKNCLVRDFKDVAVLHDGASLLSDERSAAYERQSEYLFDNFLPLASNIAVIDDNAEHELVWQLNRFIALSTLCVSVCDTATGRPICASVKGTVQIGPKEYRFGPFLNQTAQQRLFCGKKFIPQVYMCSEALAFGKPSGHKAFRGDETISIKLKIDADSLGALVCDVWGIFHDVIQCDSESICFSADATIQNKTL